MKKTKRKVTHKSISKKGVRQLSLPYTKFAIAAAIVMVVLFIYQNGNLNIGISTFTPPDTFAVAIVAVAIINFFTSNPLVKLAMLVLVVYSIYPIL